MSAAADIIIIKKEVQHMTQITLPHNHGESADELFSLLPAPLEFQTSSELFGLLSDESRLRIFWILCHYEECVINLSSLVGMSSPAVSHHLRQLKTRRLIVSHRSGKEVYYKAADTPQVHTLHSCLERLISLSDSTEHQTEVSNDTKTR